MLSFLRRAPLVIICISFVSGIFCEFEMAYSLSRIQYSMLPLFVFVIALCIAKKLPLIQTLCILLLSFLIGMSTVSCFINKNAALPKGEIQINFQIKKKLRENQYVATTERNQFLVEITNCDTLLPGIEIKALGEFKEIEPPKLPWSFNKKKQMLALGISHQFFSSKIISTSASYENQIQFLPQKIQLKLRKKISSAIQDSAAVAILCALLLGETSLLSKEIASDYSVAGVVHILAVSGMHVALIYELILLILKLFLRKKRKWLTFILAMTLLWGYGAITGFSASVVRACCMFSFFVLSDCFLLSRNTGNTIAGSTLLILFFQPFLIYNLGFLLSLTAVLGIVIIHPINMRMCYTENKIGYHLLSSTSITLSATITTLPLTLFIFHSFPTYFIFANLILVPWSTIILYVGITFLLFSGIPFFGILITHVLQFTTYSMNQFIHLVHYLPKAQIKEINFNHEQLLIVYALLLSITLFIFFKWKNSIHIAGISTLLFICFSYQTPANSSVLFTFYQSNILFVGNEKEMVFACNNDTLATKYIHKITNWKCQQNRTREKIRIVPFPSYFSWQDNNSVRSFASIHARNKSPVLLLNEEIQFLKADSSLTDEIQHEKILLGRGVSRKKVLLVQSFIKERNIPLQNIQSHPFIIK